MYSFQQENLFFYIMHLNQLKNASEKISPGLTIINENEVGSETVAEVNSKEVRKCLALDSFNLNLLHF